MRPITRFFRLLKADRKDIFYLYTYAIFGGIITLSLPLGIQAIMSLVLAGRLSTSWLILTTLVVIGIAGAGIFQILQLYIAELIKRRIFAKAALEFAYRIPKFNLQRLGSVYPPEMTNRFFDTVTIQKSLSKILIDFSSSGIQIVFGLALLSLYHPIFIAFSLLLLVILAVIILFTSKRGMATSIAESTEKYRVAFWLNEIAAAIPTFKILDNKHYHLERMEELVNGYLKKRAAHFRILLTQFSSIVALKTLVTAGLLIIGALLLIDNSITIGQFVASEIIIILVLNASEKLVNSMEAIYDVLTSLDKLSAVTDLELEIDTQDFAKFDFNDKLTIIAKDLEVLGIQNGDVILGPLNLEFTSGNSYAIKGEPGKGKSSLLRILSTSNLDYNGQITFNNVPLKNINLASLREKIAVVSNTDKLFYGSILENLTLDNEDVPFNEVVETCKKIQLDEYINSFKDSYHHLITNADLQLSQSLKIKILIGRALLRKPKFLVMEDVLEGLSDELDLLLRDLLFETMKDDILVMVTYRPEIISNCSNQIEV